MWFEPAHCKCTVHVCSTSACVSALLAYITAWHDRSRGSNGTLTEHLSPWFQEVGIMITPFTNGDTEAQRDGMTCSSPQRWNWDSKSMFFAFPSI